MDNGNKSSQVKGILATIFSVILILWLVFSNYTKPLDKVYSPNAFYSGKTVSESGENPLEVYSKLMGTKKGVGVDGECTTSYEVVESTNLLSISGGVVMPVINDAVKDYSNNNIQAWGETYGGETLNIDGNNNHWYLWNASTDDSNMKIVSPYLSFKFRTSNFEGNDIGVGTTIDGDYILIKNVKNWFCHINSSNTVKQHTKKIGYDSTDSNLIGRQSVDGRYTVIGIASKDTYVVGVHVENGVEKECSPADVFPRD